MSWPTVYEKLAFSQVHCYRMYLDVAACTTQNDRRARNLDRAERVREQLPELTERLGSAARDAIAVELARLDTRRAALCEAALSEALSLMYAAPQRPPEQVDVGGAAALHTATCPAST